MSRVQVRRAAGNKRCLPTLLSSSLPTLSSPPTLRSSASDQLHRSVSNIRASDWATLVIQRAGGGDGERELTAERRRAIASCCAARHCTKDAELLCNVLCYTIPYPALFCAVRCSAFDPAYCSKLKGRVDGYPTPRDRTCRSKESEHARASGERCIVDGTRLVHKL